MTVQGYAKLTRIARRKHAGVRGNRQRIRSRRFRGSFIWRSRYTFGFPELHLGRFAFFTLTSASWLMKIVALFFACSMIAFFGAG
jgi:hypothetical protein